MSGRKTKYSPEVVETICSVIARTGSDRTAYEAAGISSDTFYTWQQEKPEFSEALLAARQQYHDLCPESLITQANKVLADYLYGRATRTETTVKTKTVQGQVVEEEVTTKTMTLLPPRWAIERILGKSDHEKHLSALYKLVQAIMQMEGSSEELQQVKALIQSSLESLLLDVGVLELRSLIGVKPCENGGNANLLAHTMQFEK